MTPPAAVLAGRRGDLERDGRLLTKVAQLPVVVLWHDGRAFAIEDRCPHMGFPLHRGTVESGLLTCHWHHARFDLRSGCTLDPWADDARGFTVTIDGDDVWVAPRDTGDEESRLQQRLREGMEDGLTLVIAKAVLGLLELGVPPSAIVATGMEFGCRYRREGWGAGLTVLIAMANVLGHLDPSDRGPALVHALRFVANDTSGHAPRFPVGPLATDDFDGARFDGWYRRFIDTRASDAAERALATAIHAAVPIEDVETTMIAAVTDHVFIDEGHALDFTNKAFESLEHIGVQQAPIVLSSLVAQTAAAERSEESSEWQYPMDLRALAASTIDGLAGARSEGAARRGETAEADVAALAWRFLDDDPRVALDSLTAALRAGMTDPDVARAAAYAAALRIVRFHTQNDHGDWNTVHHAFTTANALHHSIERSPAMASLRGVVHGVLRLHLDRFLNIPPARLPAAEQGDLGVLARCFDHQGGVDEAGILAFGFLRGGGSRSALIALLGHRLLGEDAGFHWYQVFEAGVRQALSWPEDSVEAALILAGFARFLAAHTPTRRELPSVVRIATRLRRGDRLFEDETGGGSD